MKTGMKYMAWAMCLFVLSSCASTGVKRGVDSASNSFYSTINPSVRITFAENFYLDKNNENAAKKLDYIWRDRNNYMWICVDYRKNITPANRVDYYYPIDTVLYNMYGSRNMNLGYGSTTVHGYKVYYSDYIKHKTDNSIYIIRHMVLPSSSHDWVEIRLGHTFSQPNFKEKYHSPVSFFSDYPEIKKDFYDAVGKAIASIQPCDLSEFDE
ncbi:MAG: hypothetical protein GY859_31705 [Desulfobacterales bacterium]|nr:hypothetical protein [Desulfobacterales bacterium]